MFSTTEITSAELLSDNPLHQRLLFAYIAASQLLSGEVLEVGCGVGRGLEAILQHCQTYTAIDKNEALIAQLQEEYPQHRFLAQHLPPFKDIPSDHYDFVISFQVIEHIQNDSLFVAEIQRVLKPGGKAIITTPNRRWSLTRNPWHIREYTETELQALLQKHFAVVECKGVAGNDKVMRYYEENKKSVQKYKRLDILRMEQWLPSALLRIPYDILNRLNRKKLLKAEQGLTAEIRDEDYFLSPQAAQSLDLFYIATK